MKNLLLLFMFVSLIFGCASGVLSNIESQAVKFDQKTLEWVNKNRDAVCARAKKDANLQLGLNQAIVERVLHPEFCAQVKAVTEAVK